MFHDITYLATDGNFSVTVPMYAGTFRLFCHQRKTTEPLQLKARMHGAPITSLTFIDPIGFKISMHGPPLGPYCTHNSIGAS